MPDFDEMQKSVIQPLWRFGRTSLERLGEANQWVDPMLSDNPLNVRFMDY